MVHRTEQSRITVFQMGYITSLALMILTDSLTDQNWRLTVLAPHLLYSVMVMMVMNSMVMMVMNSLVMMMMNSMVMMMMMFLVAACSGPAVAARIRTCHSWPRTSKNDDVDICDRDDVDGNYNLGSIWVSF